VQPSDVKPESEESELQPEVPDKPFWPVAAAFLAAGFGCLMIGILTTLSEASSAASDWLAFSAKVGPLSGKTIVGVGAWLLAWLVLYFVLRGRDIVPRTVYWITGIMIGLGLLGTFPSFFEKFAGE
jgi:hypothetical protein